MKVNSIYCRVSEILDEFTLLLRNFGNNTSVLFLQNWNPKFTVSYSSHIIYSNSINNSFKYLEGKEVNLYSAPQLMIANQSNKSLQYKVKKGNSFLEPSRDMEVFVIPVFHKDFKYGFIIGLKEAENEWTSNEFALFNSFSKLISGSISQNKIYTAEIFDLEMRVSRVEQEYQNTIKAKQEVELLSYINIHKDDFDQEYCGTFDWLEDESSYSEVWLTIQAYTPNNSSPVKSSWFKLKQNRRVLETLSNNRDPFSILKTAV